MEMYRNVMELLVEEEVNRQIRLLARTIGVSLKRTEIAPYALNRLPSLYASTQEGLEHQLKRGRQQFGKQITQIVKQAIVTVRRNPSRICTPLTLQGSARKPAAVNEFPGKRAIASSFKSAPPRSQWGENTVVQPRRPSEQPSANNAHPIYGDMTVGQPARPTPPPPEKTTPPGAKREVSWQEYKRLRKTKHQQDDDGWNSTFLR